MNNYLSEIVSGKNLSHDEMKILMREIMDGSLLPNLVSGILAALATKGETIEEITAATEVLRENYKAVNFKDDSDIVDTCGTGGDGLKTFNISTCSAFVAAGAGVRVAKHGGRSISSSSGSADVLEKLGVNVSIDSKKMKEMVEKIGIGFMFAPNFHPAMKNVAPIRKDLGIRTIFNLLGPLANPANARRQVIGVYKKNLTEVFAKVLKNLGSKKILVVHGADGMDEISMSGTTFVSELSEDSIKNYAINPEMFNLKSQPNDFLYAEDVFSSKNIILKILQNEDVPAKNIVLLNAAAAIYVADKAESLKDAIYLALKSIESGAALSKLEDLVKESNE